MLIKYTLLLPDTLGTKLPKKTCGIKVVNTVLINLTVCGKHRCCWWFLLIISGCHSTCLVHHSIVTTALAYGPHSTVREREMLDIGPSRKGTKSNGSMSK